MSENHILTSELVVLEAGRQKRKAIKDLKQGVGQLTKEIQEAAQSVAEQAGVGEKEVIPVVVMYRRRGRKRTRKQRGLLSEILRIL